MRETLYAYSLRTGRLHLLRQWAEDMNDGLMPWDVSRGSSRKYWWRCEQGHTWMTKVKTRTDGYGCPICAGQVTQRGEKSLAELYPALAAQWHPERNGDLTPEQVTPGSHRKIWWLCEKGHEWKAVVKSRTQGSDCPYCKNTVIQPGVNDLATLYPHIAAQWHPARNGLIRPDQVMCGSTRKVWWRCEKGHEYQSTIHSRTKMGTACPVCAGKTIVPGENDLASQYPELARQWDAEKNDLTPESVTPHSNRRVWWRCDRDHSYPATVTSRVNGHGCPCCAGRKVLPGFNDLATQEPRIAAQWHPTLNQGLTPTQVTTGSRRKVWWICPNGHVWKSAIYSRARSQKCGCPVCAGTARKGDCGKTWYFQEPYLMPEL